MAKEDLSLAGLLKTPGQARREQLEKLRAEGATAAQTMLTAGQGFRSPIGGAISQLASTGASIMPELIASAGEQGLLALGGVAGAAGRPDVQAALERGAAPQPVQEARAVQELTKQYGTDSEGLYKIAEQLRKNGRADLAIRFEDKAKERELKERELDIELLKAKGKADEVTYGPAKRYKDSKGNLYSAVQVRRKRPGKDGKYFTYEFQPISPGAPDKPVGAIDMVEEYAQTAQEALTTDVNTANMKDYTKARRNAIDELPTAINNQKDIISAIEIAETLETGGWENMAKYQLEKILGEVPADKAKFVLLTGQLMYQNLKPFFGGVISEGERAAVEELYASIQQNPAANVELLKQMKKTYDRAIMRGKMYLEHKTPQAYEDAISNLVTEAETTTKSTTTSKSWNDLPE